MESVATIKIKIPKNHLLLETMQQYSQAIQYIADEGFKSQVSNRYQLHHLCYYDARKLFGLPSQFIINANRIASQTLKTVKTNRGRKPQFKPLMPLAFDKRSSAFFNNKIKLTTLKGRVEIPLDVPECYFKYLDWDYRTCNLTIDKQGRYFLHITLARDINAVSSDGLLGVDVGINHIAVTSNRQFFSGKQIKSYRLRFKRLRARLQSKGTRSAEKLLRKVSGRERRFKAYWNHVISKQIVSNCDKGTIVLENLKGIRKARKGKNFNFWLNGWSFFQLQEFIKYKAARQGIEVIKVNPYHTSQTCSRCSRLGTRFSGYFACHCGYSLNADLNASYNLAKPRSMTDAVSAAVTQPHIQCDESKTSS